MIFLFIFLSCILGSTAGLKEIENDLNYPDASGTSKVINPFLTRITRDVFDSSNFCILPSSQGIKSYTIVECEHNCVIQPGMSIPPYKIVRVHCDPGYGPVSDTQYDVNFVCMKGKWLKREPECVKLCPPLKKEHLILECFYDMEPVRCDSFMRSGTIAKFRCDNFYQPTYDPMSYSNRTTCLDGGRWSESLPTCSLVCGLVNQVNKVDATLVFANKTTYSEYPWHVAIYVNNVFNRYEYICGGSLIAENFVLTAAHCMFNPNASYVKFKESDLKVAAGKGKRDYYIQEQYQVNSDVINIIIPDTYVGYGTRYAEDIALLETDVSFKFNHFVLPVCLDRFGIVKFEKNTKGTIAGWGLNEDGTLSGELRVVHLPIMPIVQCRIFFPHFLQFLTSDKYCVIDQNGLGTEMGDSGGGMTFHANGQHYIHGIVSIKKTDSTLFSAFTNVSTYIEWIYNSMKNRLVKITNTPTTPLTTTTTTTTTITSAPITSTPTTTPPTSVTSTSTTTPLTTTTTPLTTTTTPLTSTTTPTTKDNAGRTGIGPAKPRLYSFMAFLVTIAPENILITNSMCSGALISNRWVLTSALCAAPLLHSRNIPPEWVILGDLDIVSFLDDARPQMKRIVQIFIHPDYQVTEVPYGSIAYNINNGLALLKLDSPVVFNEYVAPACLPSSDQIPVEKVVLNGWGRLPNNSRSLHLLVAERPVVNITEITECIQPKEKAYRFADRVICAKHRICKGIFSGSPLTFTQDGGCSWKLIGIAAYRRVCNATASYTRVSPHLPWIKSTMWLNP